MTDLRSACIEAMADAIFGASRIDAEAALDALLGVLEEHADEWQEAAQRRIEWPPTRDLWPDHRHYLAVLLEDT